MASTSESEDFESADEDFIDNTKLTASVSPPSLKSICQTQNAKQLTKPSANVEEEKDVAFESVGSSGIKVPSQQVPKSDSKLVDPVSEESPIERRRRQQKTREPKAMPSKKLGTRINAPTKSVVPTAQPETVGGQAAITEPDPYAKFRGYSKLPTSPPGCWEHDADGNVIDQRQPTEAPPKDTTPQENVASSVNDLQTDATATAPDPYAKFRGYAKLPTTPPVCWEQDADGNVIVDHRHPTMTPSKEKEPPKNVTSEANEQQTDAPATVPDPYAKFRGYSKLPTSPPGCWEHDVDGNVIDQRHPTVAPPKDTTLQENLASSENDPQTDATATAPDPYAKFRGYAKLPTTPPVCWEQDADGNVIVEHRHPTMAPPKDTTHQGSAVSGAKQQPPDNIAPVLDENADSLEAPETGGGWEDDIDDVLDTSTASSSNNDDKANEKQADATDVKPDPYAKFRGYSKPPVMEACWEPGADFDEAIQDEIDAKYLASISKAGKTDENLGSVFDKLSQSSAQQSSGSGWGGWGNWGVSSLLSSATESVSTLTSHVSSVLESSIGAPNPEDLARMDKLEEKLLSETKPPETSPEQSGGMFGLGQLMTSVTSISKLVETTGSKVIHGGLDTLETIGKKTMEVLQEGDPGLKKKRAMFTDKTVLSQVLREAKVKAEMEDKEVENEQAMRKIHFETLFDDFQGLVHLEALEMLSKQCDMKIQSRLLATSGATLSALQDKYQEIKDLCQLPDDDEVTEDEEDGDKWLQKLASAEKELGVPIATGKLEAIWKEITDWIQDNQRPVDASESKTDEQPIQQIHEKGVSTLARLTAISVEQFHKGAELLLVYEKRNASNEAKALLTITTVLCSQVSMAATRFCEHLNSFKGSSQSDAVNSCITNIFLEASNSGSYIQEAFQLLIPVLQVGVS